jgi:hypothetical protein
LFFWKSFGRRDTSSITLFAFLEEFRVERTLLYYHFCFSGGVSGGENPALLPFLLFSKSFGRRDTSSATVFAFLEEFRAERHLLCYRFCFPRRVSGGENPALLPFLFFWKSFGRRDTSSITLFAFLEEFRVERTLLYYRFCFSGRVSGGETPALLPFLLS